MGGLVTIDPPTIDPLIIDPWTIIIITPKSKAFILLNVM